MPKFKLGDKRPENAGRKKGQANKINTDVRQFVLDSAQKFEGTPGKGIADVDPEVFWSKIFPKVIPKDVNIKAQIWTRTLSDDELNDRIQRLLADRDNNGELDNK